MNLPSTWNIPRPQSQASRFLFIRIVAVLAVLFVPLLSVHAQMVVPQEDRRAYTREFADALPEGSDFVNASPQAFEAAVQKVILAHPASKAPAVAYAMTMAVPIKRVTEIAEAICKLFDAHPELHDQTTDIAKAMTDACRARGGNVASRDGKEVRDFKNIEPLGEEILDDIMNVFNRYPETQDPIFPRGVQPGEIISHETPVINL